MLFQALFCWVFNLYNEFFSALTLEEIIFQMIIFSEKGGCCIRLCYFMQVCSINKPLSYFQRKGDVVSGFIISCMCAQ